MTWVASCDKMLSYCRAASTQRRAAAAPSPTYNRIAASLGWRSSQRAVVLEHSVSRRICTSSVQSLMAAVDDFGSFFKAVR